MWVANRTEYSSLTTETQKFTLQCYEMQFYLLIGLFWVFLWSANTDFFFKAGHVAGTVLTRSCQWTTPSWTRTRSWTTTAWTASSGLTGSWGGRGQPTARTVWTPASTSSTRGGTSVTTHTATTVSVSAAVQIPNTSKITIWHFSTLSILIFICLKRFYEQLIGIISIWTSFILQKSPTKDKLKWSRGRKVSIQPWQAVWSCIPSVFMFPRRILMDGGALCRVNDDTILNL